MQSLLETNVPSGQNGRDRQAGRERPSGRIQIDDQIRPRLTPDFDNRDMAGIRGVSDLRRRTTFVRNNEHHRYVNHRRFWEQQLTSRHDRDFSSVTFD